MTKPIPPTASRAPLEVVARLHGAMPTGVTVAPNGRIFLNHPQWGDAVPFAVGELKAGQLVAYPDAAMNAAGPGALRDRFICVQSVVADAANRLWVLDTGAPGFRPPQLEGGAKLVGIDLETDRVVATLPLGADVVLPSTYLNDIRFDLRQGAGGIAYITDSAAQGPGGLILVDLASGRAMRRLSGHASTMPDPDFIPVVEGETLMVRPAEGPPSRMAFGSDGIAISADGETLYYCPLSSRHLYAVPTALRRDPSVSEAVLAAAVQDLGVKGASDGLAEDDRGRIYATDYENNAIHRLAEGRWETIAQDPRLLWPDTLSVGTDGYLYVTANQLHRQAGFHQGVDRRQQPYLLLRLPIGAGPVLLR